MITGVKFLLEIFMVELLVINIIILTEGRTCGI